MKHTLLILACTAAERTRIVRIQPTKRLGAILFLFATLIFSPNATHAQFTQQGNKLVATDAVGNARQGISVSLSQDGNTALVGGQYDNGNTGATWVFTRTGGVWSQEGSKLVGTGNTPGSQQGFSVSLSSDGNTAIVGGVGDNGFAGATWVFAQTGSVWSQQGNKLVGTGGVGNAMQGYSVSLSSDGNTALVGGSGDNSSYGAAWVFTRTGGVWSQQGSKLVGTGAVGSALQGFSVSLSEDGNTAIVGGLGDNSSAGAAWVYTRTGGVWSQQGNKLVGTGAVGSAMQGSVSLSSDGNTAIVGGIGDNSFAGAAWVFTRMGGVWSQQGTKLVGTGAVNGALGARQGRSVSLSSDGNKAIIGGFLDNNSAGAAWVFTRTGGVWSQVGNKLVGTGAVGQARQSLSAVLSSDGNTAIVGGAEDNNEAGAAWVFVNDIVPIQLASFSATRQALHTVFLEWVTLTEINNYGFEVQRKNSGEPQYQTLPNSFIPGHGTTLEPHYYSFTDATAPTTVLWYRLKQMDLDGTVHYTEGVQVEVLTSISEIAPREFSLFQNYPNPFNASTTISYQLPRAGRVTIRVYDVLGREVATLADDVEDPGYKTVRWDAGNGGSGVYFYRLSTANFVQTRKLILLR